MEAFYSILFFSNLLVVFPRCPVSDTPAPDIELCKKTKKENKGNYYLNLLWAKTMKQQVVRAGPQRSLLETGRCNGVVVAEGNNPKFAEFLTHVSKSREWGGGAPQRLLAVKNATLVFQGSSALAAQTALKLHKMLIIVIKCSRKIIICFLKGACIKETPTNANDYHFCC